MGNEESRVSRISAGGIGELLGSKDAKRVGFCQIQIAGLAINVEGRGTRKIRPGDPDESKGFNKEHYERYHGKDLTVLDLLNHVLEDDGLFLCNVFTEVDRWYHGERISSSYYGDAYMEVNHG